MTGNPPLPSSFSWRASALLVGLFVVASTHASAQATTTSSRLEVIPVKGNVYLIAGKGMPNITMQAGDQFVVLVDAGPANRADDIKAAVRTVTNKPIGIIINTSLDPERIGSNEPLAEGQFYAFTSANQQRSQAAIVGHQNLANHLFEAKAPAAQVPTDTYDEDHWHLTANDEAIILDHPVTAHSDSDTVVFFRRSDVVSTGALFDMTKYPVIDEKHGGSLEGTIKTLNHLSRDVVVPGQNEEGGTYIIPGSGHIVDRNDLANYRDMLTIIRDRIQDLIKKGRNLEQVKAAKPTYDYDGGYGVDKGSWTTDMFIETVFRELSKAGPK
jgi:cyclase